MVLLQNWPFFQLFIFRQCRPGNVFYDILEQKNDFLRHKNKKFKKSKNWDFSKGVNPWFGSKNGHFSNFLFLCDIDQENVFYDILEQKNAFLSHKNQKFKNSKNWDFSKGANPWVLAENSHFSNFLFLGNIGEENVFYDILEQKNDFVRHKNKKFKKSKN